MSVDAAKMKEINSRYPEKVQKLNTYLADYQKNFDRIDTLAADNDLETLRELAREYLSLGYHSFYCYITATAAKYDIYPELKKPREKQDIQLMAKKLKEIFPTLEKCMKEELEKINKGTYDYHPHHDNFYRLHEQLEKTEPVTILHGGALGYIVNFLNGREPGYLFADGQLTLREGVEGSSMPRPRGIQVLPIFDKKRIYEGDKERGHGPKMDLGKHYSRQCERILDYPAVLLAEISPEYLYARPGAPGEAGFSNRFLPHLKNIRILLMPKSDGTNVLECDIPPLALQQEVFNLTGDLSFLDNLDPKYKENFNRTYPDLQLTQRVANVVSALGELTLMSSNTNAALMTGTNSNSNGMILSRVNDPQQQQQVVNHNNNEEKRTKSNNNASVN